MMAIGDFSIFFSGLIFVLGALLFSFSRKHGCAQPIQYLFAYFAVYYGMYLLAQISSLTMFRDLTIVLGFVEGPILLSAVLNLTIGKKRLLSVKHFIPAFFALPFLLIASEQMTNPLYIAAAGSRAIYAIWSAVYIWGVYKEAHTQNWYRWISLFVYYVILLASVKAISATLYVADSTWGTPAWIVFVKTAGAALLALCLLWWALMKPEIYRVIGDKTNSEVSDFDHATYDKMVQLFETEEIYTDMDINLAKVADLVGVTERELSTAVNRVAQKGFRAVLRDYRLNKARELLTSQSQNNRTILDISLEAGFASKSVFNIAFREETGFTPTAYMKSRTTSAVENVN